VRIKKNRVAAEKQSFGLSRVSGNSPGKGANGTGMTRKTILDRLYCQHYSEKIRLV